MKVQLRKIGDIRPYAKNPRINALSGGSGTWSGSMTPAQLAAMLRKAGAEASAATIREHVRRGAPADKKGRVTLAGYAAWLAMQMEG